VTRRHLFWILSSVVIAPFWLRTVRAGLSIAVPGRSRSGLIPVHAFGQTFAVLKKPLSDWKRLLPGDSYAVLFNEATERPNSSPLNDETRPGHYICAACYLPLFDAGTKYESGTGWPSFFAPIESRLETKRDWKLIIPRTEYHCVRCGGHQGHVFSDGPPPTGKRWCNNGIALEFIPSGEPLPTLRT